MTSDLERRTHAALLRRRRVKPPDPGRPSPVTIAFHLVRVAAVGSVAEQGTITVTAG
jgi:hypothetical protein